MERITQKTSVLDGALQCIGVPTLLMMLEMERRSGIVEIRGGAKQVGRLWLREGQVVSALIPGTSLRGREAVYEILQWNQGRFSFSPRKIGLRSDSVACTTSVLLLQAAYLADHATAA